MLWEDKLVKYVAEIMVFWVLVMITQTDFYKSFYQFHKANFVIIPQLIPWELLSSTVARKVIAERRNLLDDMVVIIAQLKAKRKSAMRDESRRVEDENIDMDEIKRDEKRNHRPVMPTRAIHEKK